MKCKIKDLTIKIASGATPKGGASAYKLSGITLIRSQNILDYEFNEEGLAFIDEEQAAKLSNVVIKESDILLNITGDSVARCCITPSELLPARVNQHVMLIRVNKEKGNSDYIFYYFQYIKNYLIQLSSGGATRKALTKGMIENIEIRLPDRSQQDKVSKVLNSITLKIENNNAIISNLEDQAQAIFKSWFVDFEPFQEGNFVDSELGEIPEGWQFVKLKDIAQITMGVSPKSETYNELGNGLPLLNGAADFDGNKLNPKRFTSDPKRISTCNEWILCIRGTIGNFAFSDGEYALGRGVASIKGQSKEYSELIYCYIKNNIQALKSNATGSVISGLSKKDLEDILISLPEKNILTYFHKIVSNIQEMQRLLVKQNENLTQLRDTLLPKLMSGELRLGEDEIGDREPQG